MEAEAQAILDRSFVEIFVPEQIQGSPISTTLPVEEDQAQEESNSRRSRSPMRACCPRGLIIGGGGAVKQDAKKKAREAQEETLGSRGEASHENTP